MEKEQIYKSSQNFVIIYSKTFPNEIQGKVYATINWEKGSTGWSYTSASSGGEMYDDLNDDCKCLFEISICWRGCWDNRIYFKQEEYFSEDLEDMKNYVEEIEKLLQEEIKVKYMDGKVIE